MATSNQTGRLPISVVIPTYNRQDFIGATLETVFAQTLQPAEILVVDDSSDRTAEIAESYGAQVIRGPRAGVSAARNVGINAASQPWIAFLDSDDLWLPNKLALQWEALRLCPKAAIVFSDFGQFDDSGALANSTLPTHPNYLAVKRAETAPGMYCCDHASVRDAMVQTNFMLTSSLIVRRDLLISVGLFDPELCHREDHELLLRLLNVATAASVETTLVRYRRHSPNSLVDQWSQMLNARSLIADRIIRQPERYPAAALERFARSQPIWLRRIGVKALSDGEFSTAADAFSKSLRRRFSLQALLWFVVASFGRVLGAAYVYRGLRAFRRKLKSGTAALIC